MFSETSMHKTKPYNRQKPATKNLKMSYKRIDYLTEESLAM
jgi:hypothetical protein